MQAAEDYTLAMINDEFNRRARAAGILLVIAAVALPLASAYEFAPGEIRGDGDNPADSIEYLRVASRFYGYSGGAFIIGGGALATGVMGTAMVVRRGKLSLSYASASAFGVIASAFLVLAGTMRLQATGTVLHIAELDKSWGESAYLTVQLAGTQGALSAAVIALASWLLATAILAWRRRARWLAIIGILPLALLLLYISDLIGVTPELSDAAFLVYVSAIVIGLPAGCALAGAGLLFRRTRERLGTAPAQRRSLSA